MKQLLALMISSALACSSLESVAAVDPILHNAKVYTAEPGQPLQQAVAVENGKVFAVGSETQVLRLKEPGPQVIDLAGKVLMPGFIDSHSHTIKGGFQLLQANLDGQTLPLDELEQRLRQWSQDGKAKHGEILSVGGLPSTYWSHVEKFEQRFNQGEWADKSILFVGWDLHTGWANQAMLKRAGIDASRVKPLNVIASMQLYWASADESNMDLVKPYVSAMAFMYMFPARSLLKNGATIAGASDWSITTPDPWKAIYQAVSLKGPKGVLNAAEDIDRETMFQAYTLNAARTIRLENQIGLLKPGKQADMIVLDRDVFQVKPEALRDTQALKTYFAGREIFTRKL